MAKIEIDSDLQAPVRQQLVEQLRYLIATGHYAVQDPLPSTRTLGDQLDVSFHTVRKAYQQLEEEGLLSSKVGSGYTVENRSPLPKRERMERGAEIVQRTLCHLIGLGLNQAEIESLFQEQANLLDHARVDRKLLVVGSHPELNEICARQISTALQQRVQAVSLVDIGRHADADYIFTTYPHLPDVMEAVPRGDTMGFVTHLPSAVLEQVARLLPHEHLGLVTRYRDTISPLSKTLRADTAFEGEVVAASVEEGSDHVESVVKQADLLLHTPESRRRLLHLLGDDAPDPTELTIVVSQDALDAIVEAVPA